MSEFVKQSTEAAEQYMNFLAKTQEQILENARQIPTIKAQDLPQFNLPQFNLPQAPVELPTARELSQSAFSFTEKLIAQQRSFVEQYLDIAENKTQEAAAATSKKK